MKGFILIYPAQAHSGEGEEMPASTSDYVGPLLALIIIVTAIVIARRIRNKKTHESHTDTP